MFLFHLSQEGGVYRRNVLINKKQDEVQTSDGTGCISSIFHSEDVDICLKNINIPIS